MEADAAEQSEAKKAKRDAVADEGAVERKKKRNKKKKNKARSEAEASAQPAEATVVPQPQAAVVPTIDGASLKKKKKKKRNKLVAAAQGQQQDTAEVVEPGVDAAATHQANGHVNDHGQINAEPQQPSSSAEKPTKKKKVSSAERSNGPNGNAEEGAGSQSKKAKVVAAQAANGHGNGHIKQPHPTIVVTPTLTPAELKAARETDLVTVQGAEPHDPAAELPPVTSFADAPMPAEVMQSCAAFQKPSVIQAYSWPIVLQGRDMIGIAKTGSGKTYAFGLPAMVHILQSHGNNAKRAQPYQPTVLVLAPTRELAEQTAKVCEAVGQQLKPSISVLCAFGGVPKDGQVAQLKRGVHMLVATPGRLMDLMDSSQVDLSRVTYCVLDEADRMLDMGFKDDVKRILSHVSQERQTLMFSATWPEAVRSLAATFMKRPVKVTVGSKELAANHSVEQHVEVIDQSEKRPRLLELVKQYRRSNPRCKILVFVLYKKEVPDVQQFLSTRGFAAAAINSDFTQKQRSQVLADFKSGKATLLVATDVAARGLDVKDVEVVINYTFPLTVEEYVHRIGRTGRAGATGISHTFFTVQEKPLAGALGNILREAKAAVPEGLLKFGQHTKRKAHPVYGDHYNPDADLSAKPTKTVFHDSDDDE